MSVEHWRPFREIGAVRDWIDHVFEEALERGGFLDERVTAFGLPVDVVETETGYELRASVPGLKPEDLKIEITGDVVSISGEMKPQEREEKGPNFIYRERRTGSFFRQLRLPRHLDPEKAEAHMKDGVLRLILPIVPSQAGHKIEVKTAE